MRLAAMVVAGFAVSVVAAHAGDEARTPAQKAQLEKYAGSYDLDTFLKDPLIAPELKSVVGAELSHLRNNLSVIGPVALAGGVLSTSGNAAHMGGEENAVICVDSGKNSVSVGILSGGKITVYSRQAGLDAIPGCIKDWTALIAQLTRKPGNVVLKTVK